MNRVLVCLPEDRNSATGDRIDEETSSKFEKDDDSCGGNRRKLKLKSDTSHRDIEKRRRDRINRSLWLLKDLIPSAKGKYGTRTGRLEKAELLEMAVEHLRHLNDDNGKSAGAPCSPTSDNDVAKQAKRSVDAEPTKMYSNGFRDGALKILLQLADKKILSEADASSLSMSLLEHSNGGSISPATTSFVPERNFADLGDKRPCSSPDGSKPVKRARMIESVQLSDSDGADSEDNSSRSSSNESFGRKSRPRVKHVLADSSRASPLQPSQKYEHDSTDDKIGSASSQAAAASENNPFGQFPPNPHLNPVLLPAYALHASGTHYVPVILPPWGIFPPHPSSSNNNTVYGTNPVSATSALPTGIPEFKLAGPNPFFAPGALNGHLPC